MEKEDNLWIFPDVINGPPKIGCTCKKRKAKRKRESFLTFIFLKIKRDIGKSVIKNKMYLPKKLKNCEKFGLSKIQINKPKTCFTK